MLLWRWRCCEQSFESRRVVGQPLLPVDWHRRFAVWRRLDRVEVHDWRISTLQAPWLARLQAA